MESEDCVDTADRKIDCFGGGSGADEAALELGADAYEFGFAAFGEGEEVEIVGGRWEEEPEFAGEVERERQAGRGICGWSAMCSRDSKGERPTDMEIREAELRRK